MSSRGLKGRGDLIVLCLYLEIASLLVIARNDSLLAVIFMNYFFKLNFPGTASFGFIFIRFGSS